MSHTELTKEARHEMEVACSEVQHSTHTELVRYSKVCTPELVQLALEELADVEDALAILESESESRISELQGLLSAARERAANADARAQSLAAQNLVLQSRLEEAEKELRDSGYAVVTYETATTPSGLHAPV